MKTKEHARRRRSVNRMLKLRNRLGMNNKELAELVGCHPTSISGWDCDKNSVPTGARVEAVELAVKLLTEEEARILRTNGSPPVRLRVKDPVPAFPAKPTPVRGAAPLTVGERVVDSLQSWLSELAPREFEQFMLKVLLRRAAVHK